MKTVTKVDEAANRAGEGTYLTQTRMYVYKLYNNRVARRSAHASYAQLSTHTHTHTHRERERERERENDCIFQFYDDFFVFSASRVNPVVNYIDISLDII